MPATFDIVVVGAGGGPDETNLSAYVRAVSGVSVPTHSQLRQVSPQDA